ncbi:MAG: hypothetical protein ABFS86_02535 [Planctomycetota bacterium]
MARTIVVLSVLTLLFVGGPHSAGNGVSPDGTPDISGIWVGKLKYANHDQTGTHTKPDKGRQPIELDIGQEGPNILVGVTVTTGDGPISFDLEGLIGNGHFWVKSTEVGLEMFVVGHVSKNGKKIKATVLGSFLADAYVSEVKFTVKRPKIRD